MSPALDAVPNLDYVGEELEVFQLATNWKKYLASRIRPYLSGDVLEVGAGLGANVAHFHRDELSRWLSLEPDDRLCHKYLQTQAQGGIPARCEMVHGTLANLSKNAKFDSIIYIDVLEHIENDKAEFALAFERLKPAGHLVILCPAHNFLYSPFDKAIGHFRRYNKKMYLELSDHKPLNLDYLDCVGMGASVVNKLLLKQSYPNQKQIILWDRIFVRMSRCLDPLTLRMIGKSILGVWRK
jgi:SAM-dependent methyltransferase